MQVGTIIRKYRKDKNLTQEEVAKRLGVTAPAVNKWENGYSLPDISLLSPIARLLNISIDTLLSHEKELSNGEANRLVEEITKKLESESIDEVFQWMKQRLMEYPNCHYLTLWLTRIFDSQRQMIGLPQEEKYDAYILDSYTRVLECDDVEMKDAAAESLYYFYMNKEQYEQAEQYLTYFSQENPERKRKQAMICSKTGRKDEAYKAYEELLYGEYQSLNKTFHNIYILALEENDYDKAHMLVDKIQKLAHLFEFGEYHEISPALELATLEKNETETLHIMERMLTNLESIGAFTKSSLYSHMTFKAISEESLTEVRQGLIKGFCDGGTYAYLKENQRWRELVGGGGKQDS
ncbi:helix-turn-helix domain-containing protein [Sinanaerobacter sp. ZZT-01]|uniref:helix-turn-helix domain-containing protein n=1 Tax=Sinanaerobacter sp. ZZT-01 TaxID=3111540 RepID=UPI002D78AEB9|nr:helix-turn-helix domain-containing protein [Sinanaerobacter sp. ZZT-01]WRR92344.1 helix-turn-helix domain-containing protein [Sinanaerobacter sp. ZZT-01]